MSHESAGQPFSDKIDELTFLTLRFDASGDIDRVGEEAVINALGADDVTDIVVFSHGWHNTPTMADALYRGFFKRMAALLREYSATRKILLVGVVWPARRWSDEPIPDFEPSPDLGASRTAAGVFHGEAEFPPPAVPTEEDREFMRWAFEAHRVEVDELMDLLQARPDSEEALARAKFLVGILASAMESSDDGEGDEAGAQSSSPSEEVFEQFTVALEQQGIVDSDDRGAAGFGRALGRLWEGVQMVARQQSYWTMKHRAGVVGERGLGPFLGRLQAINPALGVHLVGHSFGARLVSYSLKGIQLSGVGPPVRSVTLLQGAFSHFAFAPNLPFDTSRSGALVGQDAKVSGKVVACYSTHDDAVGRMYPLASFIKRQDAAGIDDATYRWGGVGYDGHQPEAQVVALLRPGTSYGFQGSGLVNIDCSSVVRHGKPPSGAHSDIVHDELAWVVLSAGGLLDPVTHATAGPSHEKARPGAGQAQERRDLVRNSVIADALMDKEERRRLLRLGPGDDVPEDAPVPVVIELSVQFEGGLLAAHARLEVLWKRHVAGPLPKPVSDTYVPCRLDLGRIQALVSDDLQADNRRQRAIYRVWPDFQVSALIDGSVSTVKADAAERAYAASGREIVWAVVDSGIDAQHPHFAGLDLRGTDVGSLHRDFTQSDPTANDGALEDDYGHGTHVAGIIAGSLADRYRQDLRVYENVQDPNNPKTGKTNDRWIDPKTPIRGMAPQTKLVSLKVLDAVGKGSSMDVVRALEYIRREVNGQSKLIRIHGVNLTFRTSRSGYLVDLRGGPSTLLKASRDRASTSVTMSRRRRALSNHAW